MEDTGFDLYRPSGSSGIYIIENLSFVGRILDNPANSLVERIVSEQKKKNSYITSLCMWFIVKRVNC